MERSSWFLKHPRKKPKKKRTKQKSCVRIVNSWVNSLLSLGPGNGQISSFHLQQNIVVTVQMSLHALVVTDPLPDSPLASALRFEACLFRTLF